MKINLLLLLLLLNFTLGKAQVITISLADTLFHQNKASFTNFNEGVDTSSFSFADELKSFHVGNRVKKLKLRNFLWTKDLGQQYHDIHYLSAIKDGKSYLLLNMKGDSLFEFGNILLLTENDSLLLTFFPKNFEKDDSIEIPVIVTKKKHNLSFNTYHLHTGFLTLEDSTYAITIWPFQMGPLIRVDTNFLFKATRKIKYYKPNEPFLLGGERYQFVDYHYNKKEIKLESLNNDDVLYGYKEGTFLKEWTGNNDVETINWDSLNVARDQPYLIYFGAKWCGWCKPELEKLKNMFGVLTLNNVGLITVTAQHKESLEELQTYIEMNKIPGISLIESMKTSNFLLEKLKIDTYPAYVFISKEGEILYRSDYKEQELSDFLYRYFKESNSN